MSTGDLHFYRSSGSLTDTIVADVSGGPFVHVDVDLGDGTVIGELSSGLTHYTPAYSPGDSRLSIYPTSEHTTRTGIDRAIYWAMQLLAQGPSSPQVVYEYGLADLFDALTHRLYPAAPVVGDPGEWDCSDFVVRFLLQAGLLLPGELTQEPRTVTPSSLAAALGVK